MNVKNAAFSLLSLLSVGAFAQDTASAPTPEIAEIKLSFLDSIKATFVYDEMASCVDSLWLKELTSLDIYEDMSSDVKNFDFDESVDYELSTELLKQRLKALDAKSPFNIEYNQGLENIIKSFLKNRKRSYARLMAISEYYFPMFEEALARYNVPLEVKYLAIVESALNPKAVSRMGATGLWQFMYQTGKQYNLQIDSYVDERSDVLKSSEAAAQYMANMYKIFGDWDLVLASYNSGPGNVAKAIRRSGGQQNYWNIRRNLPKETQGYVPAFLATMYIYEYHKEHGIVPNRAAVKHFETDTVMIKRQLSFKQISDLLDISVAELQHLNPAYKLNEVPAYKHKRHFLRLPKDKMSVFTSNEDKIYAYADYQHSLREKPFTSQTAVASRHSGNSSVRYYKVRRGDNLGSIAARHGVTVAQLKSWNRLKSNLIPVGKSLQIRGIEPAKTQTAVAKAPAPKKVDKNAEFYTIQSGDNLSEIASRFEVSVEDLKSWNNLTDTKIAAGANLRVKAAEQNRTDAPEIATEPVYYTVAKGDNLSLIASRNNISVEELREFNNMSSDVLRVGDKLIIAQNEVQPEPEAVAAAEPKKPRQMSEEAKKSYQHYYVKKGDSLFSIAQKYPGVTIADLKRWNDIQGDKLKPGMKLKINSGS